MPSSSAPTQTPAVLSAPAGAASLSGFAGIAVCFIVVLIFTRAVELGDTQVYANDIVANLGRSPFYHFNPLWEFGHLLWRPLGWALLSLLSPILSSLTSWTPFMQATFVLMAVSTASALVSVVLWYAIALKASGSKFAAFLTAIGAACSHGVLLYAHSGCAYVPGLMLVTASFYALGRRRMITAALFYAFAALFWFPFILAGAALFLIAGCFTAEWNVSLKDIARRFNYSRAIRFAILSLAAVIGVYGLAMAANRISSPAEAAEWYAKAGHGYSQSIRVVRILTGLPRSFLYLGRDGILYRRYLRHDPFAPVTPGEIATASLWKLAAFDIFVVCLFWELMRRNTSRWPLLLFLAGAAPVVFFAVVIFEPGSPERYLPALPFLAAAAAWAMRDMFTARRVPQFGIAAFLLCTVGANAYSFAAPRVAAENRESLGRLSELRSRLAPRSLVMVTTNQDPVEEMLNRSAFDSINRPDPIHLYDVIEPATLRVLHWKQEMAARTLETWNTGGDVWVSRRLWAARPLPSWNWVEGDDPRISWNQLPPFFSSLDTDADCGGPDGFRRLARTPSNTSLLTRTAGLQE